MRNNKFKTLIFVGFLAATASGCVGPALLAGSLVGPTAATVSTTAMMIKASETMTTTQWYDGIDSLDKNSDPAALRLARLQEAAREIESRIGVPVSPIEVEILATLYQARNADLETFARDRRLSRAQIEGALKTLREKGLVSMADRPGRSGGFEATMTTRAAMLGNPLEPARGGHPPVYVMAAE
ncbi:MAG: hypothetical protein KIT79_04265 [Deltaproteobacteria bacterium]|nr:hypothetical protein [Deltaproteobacteria bacterium]